MNGYLAGQKILAGLRVSLLLAPACPQFKMSADSGSRLEGTPIATVYLESLDI